MWRKVNVFGRSAISISGILSFLSEEGMLSNGSGEFSMHRTCMLFGTSRLGFETSKSKWSSSTKEGSWRIVGLD